MGYVDHVKIVRQDYDQIYLSVEAKKRGSFLI